jgi:hypothetical protein
LRSGSPGAPGNPGNDPNDPSGVHPIMPDPDLHDPGEGASARGFVRRLLEEREDFFVLEPVTE